MMTVQVRAHGGPLPDPETLHQYDQIVPGAAQRIIAMGEREQKHRHGCDIWEGVYGFLGMACALTIGIAGLASGVYLGVNDQPWLGGVAITVTLGTLATAFIVGRRAPAERAGPVADTRASKESGAL